MDYEETRRSETWQGQTQEFPPGWDEKRIKEVIAHYDHQTDDEGAAEYEAAMKIEGESVMLVPTELVPEIRRFIAERKKGKPTRGVLA